MKVGKAMLWQLFDMEGGFGSKYSMRASSTMQACGTRRPPSQCRLVAHTRHPRLCHGFGPSPRGGAGRGHDAELGSRGEQRAEGGVHRHSSSHAVVCFDGDDYSILSSVLDRLTHPLDHHTRFVAMIAEFVSPALHCSEGNMLQALGASSRKIAEAWFQSPSAQDLSDHCRSCSASPWGSERQYGVVGLVFCHSIVSECFCVHVYVGACFGQQRLPTV